MYKEKEGKKFFNFLKMLIEKASTIKVFVFVKKQRF